MQTWRPHWEMLKLRPLRFAGGILIILKALLSVSIMAHVRHPETMSRLMQALYIYIYM